MPLHESRSEVSPACRPRSSPPPLVVSSSCAAPRALPGHSYVASTHPAKRDQIFPSSISSGRRHRRQPLPRCTSHPAEFLREEVELCDRRQRQECASSFAPRVFMFAVSLPGFTFRNADFVKRRQQARDVIFQSGVNLPSAIEFALARGSFHFPRRVQRARRSKISHRSLQSV